MEISRVEKWRVSIYSRILPQKEIIIDIPFQRRAPLWFQKIRIIQRIKNTDYNSCNATWEGPREISIFIWHENRRGTLLGLTFRTRYHHEETFDFRLSRARGARLGPRSEGLRDFSRKLCRPAWQGVKSFVKPVRATIIISLREPRAHNHRLYAHNNTFAAYPRSPNYYRDGNDRNSPDEGRNCNLPSLRGLYYALHTCNAVLFSRVKNKRERERERHLELSCRAITSVPSNNGVSPERCCEIMIQGNPTGASDKMCLSAGYWIYPREKVTRECERPIVRENCPGPVND